MRLSHLWGLVSSSGKKKRAAKFKFLKGFEEIRGESLRLLLVDKLPEDRIRGWVPSYKYEMHPLDGINEMGTIDIRIGDCENIYYGGNIGYRVHEPYRGKHYAEAACRLIIGVARAHGMNKVVITCNPENLASKRTIERLGADLEGIVDLPSHNEMYKLGERRKCRFIWQVPIE